MEHFQSNVPVEGGIPGAVHVAKPAKTDVLDDSQRIPSEVPGASAGRGRELRGPTGSTGRRAPAPARFPNAMRKCRMQRHVPRSTLSTRPPPSLGSSRRRSASASAVSCELEHGHLVRGLPIYLYQRLRTRPNRTKSATCAVFDPSPLPGARARAQRSSEPRQGRASPAALLLPRNSYRIPRG